MHMTVIPCMSHARAHRYSDVLRHPFIKDDAAVRYGLLDAGSPFYHAPCFTVTSMSYVSYVLCRAAVTEWAAHVKRAHLLQPSEGALDNADPLEALCVTAQALSTKLAAENRLETTLLRVSNSISVQQAAKRHAKRLRLM
jgi:hypothetical protein